MSRRASASRRISTIRKKWEIEWGVLWGLARLAQVALREGNMAGAQRMLVDVIENFHADQNKNGLGIALDRMASLYVLTGKPEVASRLIGWSDATREAIGDPRRASSRRTWTVIAPRSRQRSVPRPMRLHTTQGGI